MFQLNLKPFRIFIPVLIVMGSISFGISQTMLNNPGFEDEPSDATTPMGWQNCERGTTPDIFPGVYGNYKEASEGETYVGIITRADGSFESIGQRFSQKLKKSTCYYFQIDLSRIDDYVGYNEALKLRVWIGNRKCDKAQMVYESDFIEDEDWETQDIKFMTEKSAKYIILEAYHPVAGTRGHILLDNMSKVMSCLKV
jgi:hypothetical protein